MNRGRRSGPNKAAGRRNDNNRIYAHPLPLLFTSPEPTSTSSFSSLLGSLGLGSSRLEVLNPHCEGVFDPATRSVWVTNAKDSRILWTRGFFGKGNLSRSEPSWLARQVNARKDRAAGKCMFVPCSLFAVHILHPIYPSSSMFFPFVLFSVRPHPSARVRSTPSSSCILPFGASSVFNALSSILIPCIFFLLSFVLHRRIREILMKSPTVHFPLRLLTSGSPFQTSKLSNFLTHCDKQRLTPPRHHAHPKINFEKSSYDLRRSHGETPCGT